MYVGLVTGIVAINSYDEILWDRVALENRGSTVVKVAVLQIGRSLFR